MSKFDLEAAKRGEVVQVSDPNILGEWIDGHFVGVIKNGKQVVIEYGSLFKFADINDEKNIRMKPKKKEMWIYPIKKNDAGVLGVSSCFSTKEDAEFDASHYRKNVAGDMQMILVDED